MPESLPAEAWPLRQRLFVAMLTPVVLLLCAGALLGYQIQVLNENAQWVDRSDAVIASTSEALRGIVDQESALRGYLLTEDEDFLEPFRGAAPQEKLRQLASLFEDEPLQRERVSQMQEAYRDWFTLMRGVVDGGDLTRERSMHVLELRKQDMDRMRRLSEQILGAEQTLRAQRAKELAFTRKGTLFGLASLLAGCALTIAFVVRRQLAGVAAAYDRALSTERSTRGALAAESWVRARLVDLAAAVQGDIPVREVCSRALATLAHACSADVGALYVSEGSRLRRAAAFALSESASSTPEQFELGEGLLGQAAADNRLVQLRELPSDYLVVRSATGQCNASELLVLPVSVEGHVHAVVELGFLTPVKDNVAELLSRAGEIIGNAIRSAEYKSNLRGYLEETQRQTEELAAQQEELRVANEELAEQSAALREAQRKMELQQAELEQTNENLARQADVLERQNENMRAAQEELAIKAAEIARANQYKSEFLANMSHELRTPLNSTLILARLLAENKEQNLSEEQIKFAQTIYSAGNDLLSLINDVLDLSRIEAGRMEVHVARSPLARVLESVHSTFEPIARQKGVRLEMFIENNGLIETDVQRVQQIVRNLLSNALKFTERGEVVLRARLTETLIEVSVEDTGIGIPADKQAMIFEAFRQADGATHRKYGGTGLGLSISRDLARLLGGDLTVDSRPGEGSTFRLRLPRALTPEHQEVRVSAHEALSSAAASLAPSNGAPARRAEAAPASEPRAPQAALESARFDDRDVLAPGRRVLLIIEDDPTFARLLVELGRELDFQCVIAETAEEGMRLARKIVPSAILLDVGLPDHSGLSVLDRLKRDSRTRHVPVHVVSASDNAQASLSMGAIGHAVKPVDREQLVEAVRALKDAFSKEERRVLVVEDEPVQRDSIQKLLSGPGVEIVAVDSVEAALSALKQRTFDCIVTDLTFPSASGFDLLDTLAGDDGYAFPPVIVYTARSLSGEEEQRLRRYSSSIIIKGARSPERLLDEVTLFLHQVEASLPPERRRMLRVARDRESIFEGRKILLAEDDVRNVFALVSVLEPKGAKVEIARNGREALERLAQVDDIALVLMDIMMPELDGLSATREIRKNPAFHKLPIIALTAKAMPDDHEKCLSAGANDYVSKPFDPEVLLSLMRVWLSR